MNRFLIAMAVCAAAVAASAQELPVKPTPKIEGPVVAVPGQELRLSVTGLSMPKLTDGLDKLQTWNSKVSILVDSPDGGSALTDVEMAIGLGPQPMRYKLYFTPQTGGIYFLVLHDANSDTVVTKRIIAGPVVPQPDPTLPPSPTNPGRVTAATFIYEKSQHSIPSPVLGALSKLNSERAGSGFVGSSFEADTKGADGKTPKQYVAALEAAKKAGLPCLVVMAGETVLRVVKNPNTDTQVLEAVK